MPATVTETVIWTRAGTPPPKDLHNRKLLVWITRTDVPELSLRTGRYLSNKGWKIDNTEDATVQWYTRLTPPGINS